MSLENELTDALIECYHIAGKEVNYWGRRYLQEIKRKGGLATARRMLLPIKKGQGGGLEALLTAGRPDLTLEFIILNEKFQPLFTAAELEVAKQRLSENSKTSRDLVANREHLFPDELELGKLYSEGAKKQIRVNAYERNSKARAACIKYYGCVCSACDFNFGLIYGYLGAGFIHVHHIKPLALTNGKYKIDPIADLRPVCPNCHAMLHHGPELMEIAALRSIIAQAESKKPMH